MAHYLKALEISRADAPLYVNIANTYVKLKKFDEARKYYLQSVKLSPKGLPRGWDFGIYRFCGATLAGTRNQRLRS